MTFLAPLLLACFAAPPAPEPPPLMVSTHIVAVPDATHIVVARGRRDRFPLDGRALPIAPRAEPSATTANPTVEFGVLIGLADTESVGETTAVLRVREMTQPPRPGDHVGWPLALRADEAELMRDPLFWVAAFDVAAVPLGGDRTTPFFDLGTLLADRSASARAITAMVAELRACAPLAPQVRATPIDQGTYLGRTLQQVLAAATEADVRAFWDHVASEAQGFVTHRFKLVDIFATWVLRGAPPADRAPSRPGVPLLLRLAHAQRLARWAEAEDLLRQRMRDAPADLVRRAELDQVVVLRRAEAALARDPADLDALGQRARAASELGLFGAAIRDLERLMTLSPKSQTKLLLGRALCGARRWEACERVFDELIAARGARDPDPELVRWRAFARTQGTNFATAGPSQDQRAGVAAPDETRIRAQIATARVLESEEAWSLAVLSWRNAVELAAASNAELARTASDGLARAVGMEGLAARRQEAERAIAEHRVADARRAVEQLLATARRIPSGSAAPAGAATEPPNGEAVAAEALGGLSRIASNVAERELAMDLAEQRVLIATRTLPGQASGASPLGRAAVGAALADLATLLAPRGAVRAETLMEEAIALAPNVTRVREARAALFAARGRWSDAFSAAFLITGQSRLASLAIIRANAARGQFGDALEDAARLAARSPGDGLLVTALGRLASARQADREAAGPGATSADAPASSAPEQATVGVARPSLTRIRALVELGLDGMALAELPALAAPDGTPSAAQVEAAWAIARPPREALDPREPVDLVPLADRLAAARLAVTRIGNAPPAPGERLRRLSVLEARQILADAERADPGCAIGCSAARQRLAAALVSDGTRAALHEAIATARLAPGSVAHQAIAALDRLAQARDAETRRDPTSQLRLANGARQALEALGLGHLAARAAVLQADAEAALDRTVDALATLRAALPRLRADGPGRGEADAAPLGSASDADASRGAFADLHAGERLLARLRAADGDRSELVRTEATLRDHLGQCLAEEDERCVARAQEALGLTALEAGRATPAGASLGFALDLYRALADRRGARRVTLALAELDRLKGAFDAAASTAGKVLDEALTDRDGDAERQSLILLGRLALSQGDLEAATKWLGAAQEAALRGQDRRAAAEATSRLGRVQVQRGDLDAGLASLRRAAADLAREGRSEGLSARVDLAEALLVAARGDRTRRSAWLTEAESVATDLQEARALGRDRLELRAALALATLHLERGRLEPAARTLAESAPLAALLDVEGMDDLPARHDALVARLALLRHDKPAAAAALVAATQRLARPLARGIRPLGEETDALLEATIGLLFELGRHDEAAEVLDLQRAAGAFQLELLRLSGRPDLAADLARLADARAKNEAARERLKAAYDQPRATRAKHAVDALVEDLKASDAALSPLLASLERSSSIPLASKALARARERLPRGTAMVEYFVAADALYLFVLGPAARTKGTPRTTLAARKVKVGAAELARTIDRYRQLLATDSALAEPLGRDLYRWLLAPAMEGLDAETRHSTTFLLLPHGPLAAVPFGALVTSAPGAPTRYALEDLRLAITSAQSLAHLLAGPRTRAVVGPILGLVDPDGTLSEARAELDEAPLPTTLLAGRDATEARMLGALRAAPATRILHFATHGRAAADPLRSALLLASGPLEVRRVATLGGTRALDGIGLVVLSACETAPALGDRPGELLSLADGFAVAGIPTLIGTLWEVDDRATRLLFNRFYLALADPSRGDTLEALRAAQLQVSRFEEGGRRPFADPRYWSAFQLIGDFR